MCCCSLLLLLQVGARLSFLSCYVAFHIPSHPSHHGLAKARTRAEFSDNSLRLDFAAFDIGLWNKSVCLAEQGLPDESRQLQDSLKKKAARLAKQWPLATLIQEPSDRQALQEEFSSCAMLLVDQWRPGESSLYICFWFYLFRGAAF